MNPRSARSLARPALLGLLVALVGVIAVSGGACGDEVPSDQGGLSSSSSSGGGGTPTTSSPTSSSSSGHGGMPGTGGMKSTGGMGGAGGTTTSDCFPNPTTYFEIINACTNAQKVDVMPTLPLLEPDGGLPPLP